MSDGAPSLPRATKRQRGHRRQGDWQRPGRGCLTDWQTGQSDSRFCAGHPVLGTEEVDILVPRRQLLAN